MELLIAGARHEDFRELGRPECPLFFAGEHTYGDEYATVHGAYLSGLREAGLNPLAHDVSFLVHSWEWGA